MTKFIVIFVILFILSSLFNKNKKIFCILVMIVLASLLSLRNMKIGLNDTANIYYPFFLNMNGISFKGIFLDSNLQDFGFFIIMKIIRTISDNYQICIGVFASIYIMLVMFFIYKNSKDAFFSTVIFISLYFLYGTYLMRQVIAMGILLMAYKYIVKQDFIKFLLIVILASLFHRTAFIFILAYPFCKFNKFSYKNYVYILVAFLISKYLFKYVWTILPYIDFTGKVGMALANNIYTVGNGNESLGGFYINLAILLVCDIVIRKKELKSNYEYNVLMNLSTLSCILFCCLNIVIEFYRMSLYFGIFNIILLANITSEINNEKYRKTIKYLIIGIFIIYFLFRPINTMNCNPYLLFWEG